MPLSAGQSLSFYEILGPLGAGGMGEVYRARDTRLGREVAIKVLPETFVEDEERLRRFELEARTLASLNHPNVGGIHGIDQSGDVCFLELELVSGEDLSECLARGALPPEVALDVCRQIAEGLEAAHAAGVVHRDLKPANVRVTPEGMVKVLDFGIAKLSGPNAGPDVLATEPGGLMGTPAYMSPEQARGKPVDARSDVWAFGCILFESLTGKRAFAGDTIADVLVAVTEREPDWSSLPRATPPAVRRLLERCLTKDLRSRLQAVGEARIILEDSRAARNERPGDPQDASATKLIVLAFTDVAESTALKSKLGPAEYSRFVAWHDDAYRRIVAAIPGAEILKDVGDGFMTRFPTASRAVEAALVFQKIMAAGPFASVPVRVRIGLHMGEVAELGMDVHGKSKLVGVAADLTSRVMDLAIPGQILVTQSVFDNARLYVREFPARLDFTLEPGRSADSRLELRWIAHGAYTLKGHSEPMKVFEVGVEGLAPLRSPPGSEKARRVVSEEEEQVLGWRPAIDLEIPGRSGWTLQKALYSDDRAEVWVARNRKTGEQRTFKFCFDIENLKAFKREISLFRVLRDRLGDRDDIARIYDVQLERPPFLLETEYAPLGTLKKWCTPRSDRPGLLGIPLGTRIDILKSLARAVAAAHSVNVLHKDIRPSKVLVFRNANGFIYPKLADFGAGMLTQDSPSKIGDTAAWDPMTPAQRPQVHLYTAPETVAGGAHTEQSDVYALGVLLYQMVVGDISRPLAIGWEAGIEDELLREIIASCVRGPPDLRLASAEELHRRLEAMDETRLRRQGESQERARIRARRRRIRLGLMIAAPLTLIVASWIVLDALRRSDREEVREARRLLALAGEEAREARRAADDSGRKARAESYFANLLAADTSLRDGDLRDAHRYLQACEPTERGWEWLHLAFKADSSRRVLSGHERPITCLSISPSGDRIASCGQDNVLRVWDAETGECIVVQREHDSAIRTAVFSQDGSLLTFGGEKSFIRSWNAKGEIAARSELKGEVGTGVSCFSADGRLFAFCDRDNAVGIAQCSTGKVLHVLPQQADAIHALAFDRDGSRLLLCSHAGLFLADIALETALDERPLVLLGPPEETTFAVAFAPSGEDLVAGYEDGTLRRFESSSGVEIWSSPGHAAEIVALAFSPDGSRIASGSLDKTVRIWEATSGELLTTYLGHERAVRQVAFSPDGSLVVSGSDDGSLRIWDSTGYAADRSWKGPEEEGWVASVALDPASKLILTGSGAGMVEVWAVTSGERLLRLDESWGGEVRSVAFSPDGASIAAAFEQRGVKLWELLGPMSGSNALSAKERAFLQHEDEGSVNSVAFSPTGSNLASSSDRVHLWSLSGSELATLPGEYGLIQCLAFSADGTLLAGGSGDGNVYVWTVEPIRRDREPVRLAGHSLAVYALAFDSEGKRLVSGSEDRSFRVWNLDSQESVELVGHERRVSGVAFSPDGSRAFTSSFDATLRIWNLQEGRPLLTLRGHGEAIYDMALAKDGSRLVSVSYDNTVRSWETGAPSSR